jgi:hypothetical protein
VVSIRLDNGSGTSSTVVWGGQNPSRWLPFIAIVYFFDPPVYQFEFWGPGFVCLSTAIFSIVIWIFPAVWIYRDAQSRGLDSTLWLIIGILAPIIGLIIYLLVRNDPRPPFSGRSQYQYPANPYYQQPQYPPVAYQQPAYHHPQYQQPQYTQPHPNDPGALYQERVYYDEVQTYDYYDYSDPNESDQARRRRR